LGNDIFYFASSDLTSIDVVNGGAGYDNIGFTTAGTISAIALTHVTGIEAIVLANGTNNLTVINAAVSSASNRILTVHGGSGDDTVNAGGVSSSLNRVIFRPGAGDDTLSGGAGNDIFYLVADYLTGSDTVAGGAGYDNIGFTAPGTISSVDLAHVSGIDGIVLANGANSLTITNALVSSAIARVLTVYGGTGDDTINAVSVTTAANKVALYGGGGNDTFVFSPTSLNSHDVVSGAGGADTLRFAVSGTVTAAQLSRVSGIEILELTGGGPNEIYLPPTINSLSIVATNGDDKIDGSDITTGRLSITAGAGVDTLIGGADDDTFQFTHGAFNTADRVDGGAGNDRLIISTDVATNFTAADLATVAGIERLDLVNPGYPMNVTLSDALFASAEGHRVVVSGNNGGTLDASALTAANSVTFNFGATQTVIGGAGDDSFRLGNFYSGGTLDGGAGIDTLKGAAVQHLQGVRGIEILQLSDQFSQTVEIADSLVSSATNHLVTVIGGSGNDTVDASDVTTAGYRVVLNGGGGQDQLTGSADADVFVYEDASDSYGPLQNLKFIVAYWDHIHGFDAAIDKIDLPDGVLDHNLPIDHATGQVNQFTDADDIDAALDPVLGAHEAVLFHTSGDIGQLDLLVINPTDTAGYVAGVSYIIDVTGYTGTITPDIFI
jgi:Ca2+-binding RTX toxin-like protein